MKLKKVMALTMAATMAMTVVGCGSSEEATTTPSSETAKESVAAESTEASAAESTEAAEVEATDDGSFTYADIVLGETGVDITAEIKVMSQRTDLADTKFPEYVAAFQSMYPGITVTYETITDYAEQALLRVNQADWDIMMIPAIDKKELPTYFVSYGDLDSMNTEIRFADTWLNGDQVYGVPSTGNAMGIVYNKAVFEAAGVTELPKTPDDFIAALQAIKDNTDAIPLYTNYAAGWTMGGQWDSYLGGSATGDATFMNQKFLHAQDPFADNGQGYGPYYVYKILYDAVANGLTEDDYTTTDWEGSKGMINRGEIGCMVLGSWAFTQMQDAGDNPDDIGYMPFPISVNGVQYASAGADYSYGINAQASEDNQKAAMIYVKWLTEMSNFSYTEGGIPIDVNGQYPDLYSAFDGIEFVSDAAAVAGEEDLLNELNTETELMVNAGGDAKVQKIVEHAAAGDMSFDDIMAEWNQKWTDAQTTLGVEIQ